MIFLIKTPERVFRKLVDVIADKEGTVYREGAGDMHDGDNPEVQYGVGWFGLHQQRVAFYSRSMVHRYRRSGYLDAYDSAQRHYRETGKRWTVGYDAEIKFGEMYGGPVTSQFGKLLRQ